MSSDPTSRHAAVIGIDAYGGGIAPLKSAAADARAVAEAVSVQHGYPDPHLLLDAAASLAGICRLLEETLPGEVGPDGSLLLYFAGHGVARGDGSEGPQGYLLPADAHPADESTWLSMARVREALGKLPCRHLLVVLDCCFAGSFRWAATRSFVPVGPLYDSQYARFLAGTAWQVLTSASHDERALDVVPGLHNTRDGAGAAGHSPFASALLRGLAGESDSSRGRYEPDGVITATELYQFVFEELVPAGARSHQTPGLWPLKPENSGEYIFLAPGRERRTRPDPPLDDANNPWLGLRAYGSKDAALFFGRERVVEQILGRLLDASRPLLAVVGASGTGKSSVVRAGVLPRLEAPAEERAAEVGAWTVAPLPRLAGDPRPRLEAAAGQLAQAPSDHRRLLFIDQFEELYTQCPDGEARQGFLRRLRELMSGEDPLRVMITLRSDFEPRLQASAELGELLAAGRYLVPGLSSEEFRAVIEEPAKAKALYFEPPELGGELVDEVMAMPGGLPLLSFALAEMYRQAQLRRRRTGALDRAITREDYAAAGGVVGALHRRATALFEAADPARQETIRRLFLRMVSREGGRLARRRVEGRELEYGDAEEEARVRQVLEDYVQARLLVADEGHIEPAHDTLVLAWEKLLHWLSQHGSQELLRQLWRAASEWQGARRSGEEASRQGWLARRRLRRQAAGLLWSDDPRLPQAQATGRQGELNRLEREFVEASVRRKRQRRNVVAGTTAAVIAALSVLAGLAELQRRGAVAARDAETTQRERAEDQARFAIASDVLNRDPTRAALVLLELQRPENTPEVVHRMVEALQYPFTLAELPGHVGPLKALFSQDGKRIVSAFQDGTAWVWRADGRGEPAALLAGAQNLDRRWRGWQVEAAFLPGSRDGSRIVAGWAPPNVVLSWSRNWEVSARGEWTILDEKSANDMSLFSDVVGLADSQRLRAAVDPTRYRGHGIEGGVGAVRSPDGTRIVTAPAFGEERLWDARGTGEPIVLRAKGEPSPVVSAIFSPGGGQVLTVSRDRAARLWRADGTGDPVVLGCQGLPSQVVRATFLDEDRLVLVSPDGLAVAWSRAGCATLGRLRGEDEEELVGAAFSPTGDRVLTVSLDAFRDPTARMWRADSAGGAFQLEGRLEDEDGRPSWLFVSAGEGTTQSAAFSADGARLVMVHGQRVGTDISYAELRQLDGKGPSVRLQDDGGGVSSVAISPDGRRIVGVSVPDHSIKILHEDGTPATVFVRPEPPLSVAFSPDGMRFVIGRHDGIAEIWQADGSGEPIVLRGHKGSWAPPRTSEAYEGSVIHVAFSPDGTRVVTASKDGTARVWDLSFPRLQAKIRAATPLCLDRDFRQGTLGEAPEVAGRRSEACRACVPQFDAEAARGSLEEAQEVLAAYRQCLTAKGW